MGITDLGWETCGWVVVWARGLVTAVPVVMRFCGGEVGCEGADLEEIGVGMPGSPGRMTQLVSDIPTCKI